MTPLYTLLIITYSCPFALKWLPAPLRPIAGCERREEIEQFKQAEDAMERVKDLGRDALVVVMEADGEVILRSVKWEPTVGDAK